jgi:hypothetical protein
MCITHKKKVYDGSLHVNVESIPMLPNHKAQYVIKINESRNFRMEQK